LRNLPVGRDQSPKASNCLIDQSSGRYPETIPRPVLARHNSAAGAGGGVYNQKTASFRIDLIKYAPYVLATVIAFVLGPSMASRPPSACPSSTTTSASTIVLTQPSPETSSGFARCR